MSVDKEFEEVKETIRMFVFMFKTLWDEIENQFSGLSREERFRVFSDATPFITGILRIAAMDDIVKPRGKGKRDR